VQRFRLVARRDVLPQGRLKDNFQDECFFNFNKSGLLFVVKAISSQYASFETSMKLGAKQQDPRSLAYVGAVGRGGDGSNLTAATGD